MNKDEAIRTFRKEVMPTIKNEEKERGLQFPDRNRRKQYWDKFLEIMVGREFLDKERAYSWEVPPFCNPKYDQAIQNN